MMLALRHKGRELSFNKSVMETWSVKTKPVDNVEALTATKQKLTNYEKWLEFWETIPFYVVDPSYNNHILSLEATNPLEVSAKDPISNPIKKRTPDTTTTASEP
ncbi:hypothetical protein V6N13_001531 [Hibiscus sabdariffa]